MSKVIRLFPDNNSNMNDGTFLQLVHEIALETGKVKLTTHAIERMTQRSITRGQVVEALRKGFLSESASKDVHGDWIGKISHTVAGERIAVVAKLKKQKDQFILVITTYNLS